MTERIIESKESVWHHIREVTEKDLEALQTTFKFHHLDYDDIRTPTPISKMDPYKHYVFFVFHIPMVEKKTGRVHGEELYVFLDQKNLVTITRVNIPTVESLFERLEKSSKFRSLILGKSAIFALHKLLIEVFRESLSIVRALTHEVHRLEEAVEERHDKRITVDLGHVRRDVLFLRHVIDPQRAMIESFTHLKRDYVPEEMIVYFDDVHDILDTIWRAADNLKSIIDGLFDINEALLSHKTNQIITLLTFISASLMVPSLIAGFYGMNVSWLPYVGNPSIVASLFAVGFLAMIFIVLIVIKRSRM